MAQGAGLVTFLAIAALLRWWGDLHWVPALLSAAVGGIAAWSEAVVWRDRELAGRADPLEPHRAVTGWLLMAAVVASGGFLPDGDGVTLGTRIGLGTLVFGTGLAAHNLALLAMRAVVSREGAGPRREAGGQA